MSLRPKKARVVRGRVVEELRLQPLPEPLQEPDCSCGHGWGIHNEYGCYVKTGHDDYCHCSAKPPSLVAKEKQERLERVLLYPCKEHPRYQVKRKPRLPCEKCWRMWIKVNP